MAKVSLPAGEMAEWLKAHAWKACMLQKGIEGSNPSLSASPHLSEVVAVWPKFPAPGKSATHNKLDFQHALLYC